LMMIIIIIIIIIIVRMKLQSEICMGKLLRGLGLR
jgi:hypothetical protein